MRQKQQDLEIQQAYEERKREKAAETAAREKVRQQIAQDKLERKQKELELQVYVDLIIYLHNNLLPTLLYFNLIFYSANTTNTASKVSGAT